MREVVKEGEEIGEWFAGIERRDSEKQKRKRRQKINESNYNKWYKMVKKVGIPGYLRKGWGESRRRRVIKFRLRNKLRESKYSKDEPKRKCKLCEAEMETWEHVWERCRK